MTRYICIHGHFYQPPRENPWLESVELQDSAAPWHDWNERITVECYAPNAAARILNGEGKIENIISNYSKISFNFGPTLLAWMKDKMPQTHEAIIAAAQLLGRLRATVGPQVQKHLAKSIAKDLTTLIDDELPERITAELANH